MTSTHAKGNQFTLRQLMISFALIAMACSLVRHAYSGRDFINLLSFIGFCLALGGSIGIYWNRAVLGSALGFAGFLSALFLLIFLG